MPEPTPNFTPREAARLLGISYPTIKGWILSGKLPTHPTPGGHHRISEEALAPFRDAPAGTPSAKTRDRFRKVSGRNQIVGRVVSVRIEGLLAQVVLSLPGGGEITSIITADAAREMSLKKGDEAAALVKSTDIMIERL